MSYSMKRAAPSRRAAKSAAVAERLERRQMLDATASVSVYGGMVAAEQDEAQGSFIFYRYYSCGCGTNPYESALTINYTIDMGVPEPAESEDYSGLSGTATIEPNQSSVEVFFTPEDDVLAEFPEEVKVMITGGDYQISEWYGSASSSISDNDHVSVTMGSEPILVGDTEYRSVEARDWRGNLVSVALSVESLDPYVLQPQAGSITTSADPNNPAMLPIYAAAEGNGTIRFSNGPANLQDATAQALGVIVRVENELVVVGGKRSVKVTVEALAGDKKAPGRKIEIVTLDGTKATATTGDETNESGVTFIEVTGVAVTEGEGTDLVVKETTTNQQNTIPAKIKVEKPIVNIEEATLTVVAGGEPKTVVISVKDSKNRGCKGVELERTFNDARGTTQWLGGSTTSREGKATLQVTGTSSTLGGTTPLVVKATKSPDKEDKCDVTVLPPEP